VYIVWEFGGTPAGGGENKIPSNISFYINLNFLYLIPYLWGEGIAVLVL
jgi:hypothetical protein